MDFVENLISSCLRDLLSLGLGKFRQRQGCSGGLSYCAIAFAAPVKIIGVPLITVGRN
jgi:hypothetical protein